jgi:translin
LLEVITLLDRLEDIVSDLTKKLAELDAAREQVLRLCRDVVRSAAITIKHVHRGDMDAARNQLAETAVLVDQMLRVAEPWGLLRYARFVLDAEKEYCEAALVVAAIAGEPASAPQQLGVDPIAWLNGLAEVVGEMRRHCLDLIRAERLPEAENCLGLMEDIYHRVMLFDLSDALTGGLRSRVDQARAALERTRGELTMALAHAHLADRLRKMEGKL